MRKLPGVPLFLLRLLLPRDLREAILDEIEELYFFDLESRGMHAARRALWHEIFSGHWILLRFESRRLRASYPRFPQSIWGTPMSVLLKDVRYAARQLKLAPGFSMVAVLTLALGIGASTAIFSVVNGVLLRPLPYDSPERLIYVWDRLEWIGFPRASVAGPQIDDLRNQATLFDGFASLRTGTTRLTGAGDPEEVPTAYASANLFDILGVNATFGRTFLPGEDLEGAENIAVLSYGFWQSHFGGDLDVVGTSITLDGNPTTVVGVLPRNFKFVVHHSLSRPSGAEIWVPDRINLADAPRGQHRFATLARIRDNVTFDQARAELISLGQQQDEQWYGNNGFTFHAVPLHEDLVGGVRSTLLLLLAAVGVLLSIATANIATLMLARSQSRSREVAVRCALGATRGRIMWMAFVEGGILTFIGGAVGCVVAAFGLDALLALAPEELPRASDVVIGGRIFAFAGGVILVVATICSLTPAIHGASLEPAASLQAGHRTGTGLGRRINVRSLFVVAEVALSLVLLTGAGLLVRSLAIMAGADPGFRGESVLAFDVTLPPATYEDGLSRAVFFRTLMDELRAIPGVDAASGTGTLPLGYANRNQSDCRPDVVPEGEDAIMADYMPVLPDFFTTMGIDLVAGRTFTAQDDESEDAPFVAVIDEKLARHWPNGDAVGHTISHLGEDWTVVGVVRHARIERIYEDDRPQIYAPHAQLPFRAMTVVLHSAFDPSTLVPLVRAAVSNIDSNQPIANVRTVDGLIKASTAKQRFSTTLMTAFALSGLLLAVLGVYGILSHTVTTRKREIGIRMALGAKQAGVLQLVVRQGLFVTGCGMVVGMACAIGLSRLMSAMVFEISSIDPVTYLVAPVILIAVALMACLLPARRASRVDPLVVLREE